MENGILAIVEKFYFVGPRKRRFPAWGRASLHNDNVGVEFVIEMATHTISKAGYTVKVEARLKP
ncbi:hypothetical protein KHC28_20775 [Ancylobacter sonchi]|uniref:hypothetical protein n=1 Tax=Ancylobacter sonchi TaxID=1937790 RepID=UPI001BD47402|nr:hypothetical protein [Ancylobacter sonchi]MBS7536088.1 hypothetical protein [Ancylobacter sonchi]